MGFVLPAKFICKANNENANARKIKYVSPRREESNSPKVSGIDTLPRISRKTEREDVNDVTSSTGPERNAQR